MVWNHLLIYTIYLRVMWKMASQALMWERKALPKPWPAWAPFTKPAISTTFRNAGTLLKWNIKEKLISCHWWLELEAADKLLCRHAVGTWLVYGTGRGSQSAHLEWAHGSRLGQWCKRENSQPLPDSLSEHWRTLTFWKHKQMNWDK